MDTNKISKQIWLEQNLNKICFILSLAIFFLHFLPFLILGEHSFFKIHDNLDSDFVYLKVLIDSGTLFSFDPNVKIDLIMNGIPRSVFRSGFNLTALIFYTFPLHIAYILNHILSHSIGFLGMYLLLSNYVITQKEDRWLIILLSLCFAVVPFFSVYGISISGQPLLLYAFLNLLYEKESHWRDFLIIIFFPFYSLQYFTLIFFFPFLLGFLIYNWYQTKELNKLYIFGFVLLILCFILIDWRLISSFFLSNDFVSHRTTWRVAELYDLRFFSAFGQVLYKFFFNQHHGGEFPNFWILFIALISVIYAIKNKKPHDKQFYLILALISLICIWFIGYYYFLKLLYLISSTVKIPNVLFAFQLNRFYLLLPFLQILFFAYSLKIFRRRTVFVKLTLAIVILLQVGGMIIYDYEFRQNVRQIAGIQINKPNYKQFFSTELFQEVEIEIGKPKSSYRVLALGMHPSILQYNGFYTLDGYQNNYSLSYKNKFRKIIAGELKKNKFIRIYFDYWGSWCYILTDELNIDLDYIGKNKKISDLSLNTDQIKNMNGEYIISAAEIENLSIGNLELVKKFENDTWNIYLYRVK